jgi:formylglycine-generating enzyme required for sulfatase activity
MYMRHILILLSLTLIFSGTGYANNLQIGPATLVTTNGSQYLNFTISWNNSWRTASAPFNWDAVWVFVKRRDCAGLQWRHANLAPQDTAHSATNTLFVDAYADRKGVMIYRAADGSGNISNVNIQLKLDSVPAGNYDYKVFGIEMVYVPEGAFYVGDGISTNSIKDGLSQNAFYITREDSIVCSPAAGNLWATYNMNNGGSLPDAFPKGYNTFYCMKYEVSQGQYADFLNTINSDAVINRFDPSKFNQNRYTITGSWPALAAVAPNRACNWLSYSDLVAYLDWSALSPMTELEFEKVCRGSSNVAVNGEFAWGTNKITDADSLQNGTDGQPNESVISVIDTGSGLANYGNDSILGPLRCGFAAKNATGRLSAGASYYGIMDLSGNVFERSYPVIFGYSSLNFNGDHGNGELSTGPFAGYANQGWPLEQSTIIPLSELFSVAIRGGAWVDVASDHLRISDRDINLHGAHEGDASGRDNAMGGRGVSRRQQ